MIEAWMWKLAAGVILLGVAFFAGVAHENLHWQKRWDEQQSEYASVAAAATAAHAQEIADARARNADIAAALDRANSDRARALDDAILARRLLDAARAAGSRPVPEAPDQPAAPPAGGTSGGGAPDSLLADLTAAIGECERNADRLDALIAEIRPQL